MMADLAWLILSLLATYGLGWWMGMVWADKQISGSREYRRHG